MITADEMVSYKGQATEGKNVQEKIKVYPVSSEEQAKENGSPPRRAVPCDFPVSTRWLSTLTAALDC